MKTRILFLALISIFAFSSCEDFLKEDPRGQLNESFLRTETGLQKLAVGLYANDSHNLIKNLQEIVENGTDEITFATGGNAEKRTKYQTVETQSYNKNLWKYIYNMLNDCNFGLKTIQEVEFSNENAYMQTLGEFSFFRAWICWLAVELWGEYAHYQDQPTESVVTEGYQTTIDVWYKLIIGDLNTASSYLNAKPSKVGELTMGAAMAMKARALMSLAQYSDAQIAGTGYYNNRNDVYAAAKELADQLIDPSSGYKLLSDYESIFDINNENNAEVIWAMQMTTDENYKFGTNIMSKMYTAYPPYSIREKKKLTSLKGMYEHSAWYGRYQCDCMPTYYFASIYEPGDKRAEGTFETVYQALWSDALGTYSDMGTPFMNGKATDTLVYRPLRDVSKEEAAAYKARGIYCDGLNMIYPESNNRAPVGAKSADTRRACNTIKKYLDRTRTAPKQDSHGTDINILRLGEQYLIAAECAYYLSGQSAAKKYLDLLRDRAEETPGCLDVDASKIDIDYILDERTREMGAELIRFFDLKRTGKWDRVTKYNADTQFFDPEVHCLLAVPVSELETISNYPDVFKQNPAYVTETTE